MADFLVPKLSDDPLRHRIQLGLARANRRRTTHRQLRRYRIKSPAISSKKEPIRLNILQIQRKLDKIHVDGVHRDGDDRRRRLALGIEAWKAERQAGEEEEES